MPVMRASDISPRTAARNRALRSSVMRVLVTGGAGFIGSHLTDALLARGDEVLVVDDLSSGRAARLDPRATSHKLSVTDPAALSAAVKAFGPELIFHLAAQIDVRASVDGPGGGRAGQCRGHDQPAGGGSGRRGPGAVRLLRRRPVRACRSHPAAGGGAAAARIAVRDR